MSRRVAYTTVLFALVVTAVAFVQAQDATSRPQPIKTETVEIARKITAPETAGLELVAPATNTAVDDTDDENAGRPPLKDPPRVTGRQERRSISSEPEDSSDPLEAAQPRGPTRRRVRSETRSVADDSEKSADVPGKREFPQRLGSQSVDLEPIPERADSNSQSSRRSSRRVRSRAGQLRPTPPRSTPSLRSAAPREFRKKEQPQPISTGRAIPLSNPVKRMNNSVNSLFVGRTPDIQVVAMGPKSIIVGKPATFEIRVKNPSARSVGRFDGIAHDVVLRMDIPDAIDIRASETSDGSVGTQSQPEGGQGVVWELGELAAGQEESLRLVLLPTAAVVFDFAVDWSQRPQNSTTAIEVQVPRLEMAISGPTDVNFGETRVYAIEISNPGSGPAEGVEIRLGPGAANQEAKTLGTLAAGARRKLEVEMTARDAGMMEISATATAVGGLEVVSRKQVKVRRADLQVETTGPKLKFAGTAATYRVSVSNAGNAVARSVVATAILPKRAEYLGGIATAELAAERVRWTIGELQPGAQRTFEIRCQLLTEGAHPISIRVEDANELTATHAFTTRVEAVADLKLVLNDPQGPEPVGDDVQYEIKVINRGTKAATNVQVRAYFSEGIEPTKVAGHPGELIAEEGEVRFQPIPSVGPGQTVTLTVRARAFEEGNLRFRVELEAEDPDTRLVGEESTRFFGDN
ncbi:MAG: hypothetical protein VX346_11135 [Planctomycetota bacterium]|nr:hypothetical protein [Planctomycetota bacterium]